MKLLVQENRKNSTKNVRKSFVYGIAFLTLVTTLTSCTADEVAPLKKTDTVTAGSLEIIPPTPTSPIPKP